MAPVIENLNALLWNTGFASVTRVGGNVISQTPWLPLYSSASDPVADYLSIIGEEKPPTSFVTRA